MRAAGVEPEIDLKECTSYSFHDANKVAYSGFENWRRHDQKSKRGVSVAPK